MNTKNPPLLDFHFEKQIFKVKQREDLCDFVKETLGDCPALS